MTFGLRGIMVALGFFGVLYCLLSMSMVCLWRSVNLWRRRMSSTGFASLLFWIRISPLVVSALVTLIFALPAFLLLESGVVDEDLGTVLFSVGSLLLLAAGLFRAVMARAMSARVVGAWMAGATILDADAAIPTFQAKRGIPPLLLSGVTAPKILVSETAVGLLSGAELRVSVQHEIVHLRCRDNLKKLIIHCFPFPGMGLLDRAWQEAAELAADDAAISTRVEAVELASALVKLAELVPVELPPAFTTGLVNVTMSVKLRVERLLAWDETEVRSVRTYGWHCLPLILLTVWYVAANYGHALWRAHQITEWFVH